LCGAGIGTGGCEDNCAALVGLRNRIIFNIRLFPGLADGRIRADAKLYDELWDYPEERGVVIEMMLHQIVETISADGRPCASHGHRKFGVEPDYCGVSVYRSESGDYQPAASSWSRRRHLGD